MNEWSKMFKSSSIGYYPSRSVLCSLNVLKLALCYAIQHEIFCIYMRTNKCMSSCIYCLSKILQLRVSWPVDWTDMDFLTVKHHTEITNSTSWRNFDSIDVDVRDINLASLLFQWLWILFYHFSVSTYSVPSVILLQPLDFVDHYNSTIMANRLEYQVQLVIICLEMEHIFVCNSKISMTTLFTRPSILDRSDHVVLFTFSGLDNPCDVIVGKVILTHLYPYITRTRSTVSSEIMICYTDINNIHLFMDANLSIKYILTMEILQHRGIQCTCNITQIHCEVITQFK